MVDSIVIWSVYFLFAGAIVGIVVATVLALVFLGVAAALLLILILVRRERRTHPEYSWYEGVKVVLDVSTSHNSHIM